MYREFLPDNRGMLFEFDPARPVSFWMKNCLINLDMIFLREGVVQAIAHDVPPCENDPCPTYGPPTTVNIDQVIEIRAVWRRKLTSKQAIASRSPRPTNNEIPIVKLCALIC